jgi:hypothetical protein
MLEICEPIKNGGCRVQEGKRPCHRPRCGGYAARRGGYKPVSNRNIFTLEWTNSPSLISIYNNTGGKKDNMISA